MFHPQDKYDVNTEWCVWCSDVCWLHSCLSIVISCTRLLCGRRWDNCATALLHLCSVLVLGTSWQSFLTDAEHSQHKLQFGQSFNHPRSGEGPGGPQLILISKCCAGIRFPLSLMLSSNYWFFAAFMFYNMGGSTTSKSTIVCPWSSHAYLLSPCHIS